MKSGMVMIFAMLVLVIVLVLAASLFDVTSKFIGFFSRSVSAEQATQLAEGGLDYAVQKLNDTAGDYLTEPNSTETRILSTGEVVIKIDSKSQSLKTITSTGYVPSTTAPRAKRTVKADAYISSQQVSFRYAVQVGGGGITMSQTSRIGGAGGTQATVYTNGSIVGYDSSRIEGDAFAVGTVTSPAPTVTGITCAGQNPPSPCPGPTATIDLPTVDETEWKDQADNNVTTCPSAGCNIYYTTSIGPMKYVGNLTISNNAVVTISGPIWVTGNLYITQGSTTVKLNDSFGSNGTAIIVDGKIDLSQGGQFMPTNSTPKGYLIVITHSNADDAIKITQSGSTAIFYATSGGAVLSQSAQVTALVANKLTLSQSASLEYEQGLASSSFTSGPGASWQIKEGTYYAVKPEEPEQNRNLVAVYDATYKAPTCAVEGGISCDSADTLNGRDNVAGMVEINTPNTTDSCLDDTGAQSQSRVDRIMVSTVNGLPFQVGSNVKVETWGYYNDYDTGVIDFYYKNSTTTPPYWQRVGSTLELDPGDGNTSPFYHSSTFSLTGSAGMHTLRAQFRDHIGGQQSCSRMWDWPYVDDNDDLVFNVQ